MVEILPIKVLTQEDSPIFGSLNVALGKLKRAGMPIANGIVVTPPNIALKATLELFDFGSKEIFEQSLTLVRKEINSISTPEILQKETNKQKRFLLNGKILKSSKELWQALLGLWLGEIKMRLWTEGFSKGITQGLDPQVVIFIKNLEAFGEGFFDPISDDTVISAKKGKLHPNDLKKIDEVIREANKKLFIPHEFEWIVDGGVKLVGIKPYTPLFVIPSERSSRGNLSESRLPRSDSIGPRNDEQKSAVKVFLDLSTGLVVEREVDGVFIASEKIFDLNKPRDSFEDLVFKLVESAATFPNNPVLFKLADKSEGMGKVRGTLRLLHQKSLLDSMIDVADFIRHKKNITNVHLVIPFVRTLHEFLQIKRELAVKKLMRKNSLQIWMEICTPENIINLEDYLMVGLDGVVLNLDELVSFLNGFDSSEGELIAYKNEVSGLLKFIEDGLKLLHKSKVPFIAYGSLSKYPQVLEFLVEKGVWGVVIERYEFPSIKDLLRQVERRLILSKS